MVTFATIGYGDVAAKTIIGRIIAIVCIITGLTFSALITARLADFLNLDAQQVLMCGVFGLCVVGAWFLFQALALGLVGVPLDFVYFAMPCDC